MRLYSNLRITAIDTFVMCHKFKVPVRMSQRWLTRKECTVIRISTNEGVVGWGEPLGPAVVMKAIVDKLFRPLLLDQDPLNRVVLWEKLYNSFSPTRQGGYVVAALSGVDIALWDIAGKVFGVPICKLIGGIYRDRVKMYASALFASQADNVPLERAKEAAMYVEQGFCAMKMKVGIDHKTDIDSVREVRAAIGDTVDLMTDANCAFDVADALRFARAIERYDIAWFEEPISPNDLDGYLEVKRGCSIPLAGGESEFTRFGFRDMIVRRAVDVIQPDINVAGGISEIRNIIALASVFGIQTVPHVWGGAVATAAALQVLAALPNNSSAMNSREPMLEFDCTENPFHRELSKTPFLQNGGYMDIPMTPGLGCDLDEDAIQKYQVSD